MYFYKNIKLFLLICLLISSFPSLAEEFCVTNSAEFQAALTAASNNGEDDDIRMTGGDFPPLNGNSFVYNASQTETHDLTISGSWYGTPRFPCVFSRNSAFQTVLGGSSFDRRLYIIGRGEATIEISDILFFEGFASGNAGGGLYITTRTGNQAMSILIERSAFNANMAQHGSAIAVIGNHNTTLRNSYIFNNHTESSAALYFYDSSGVSSRDIYLINNTIMGNSNDGSGPYTAAVSITPVLNEYRAFIANNIIWGNEFKDLYFGDFNGHEIYLYNNVIGDYTGTPAGASNNISAEPELVSDNPFSHPQYSSNLYNQGIEGTAIPDPPFRVFLDLGEYDAYGNDRVMNGQVDIGATEAPSDVIFVDGFEEVL